MLNTVQHCLAHDAGVPSLGCVGCAEISLLGAVDAHGMVHLLILATACVLLMACLPYKAVTWAQQCKVPPQSISIVRKYYRLRYTSYDHENLRRAECQFSTVHALSLWGLVCSPAALWNLPSQLAAALGNLPSQLASVPCRCAAGRVPLRQSLSEQQQQDACKHSYAYLGALNHGSAPRCTICT
jgi:hypothetical protein